MKQLLNVVHTRIAFVCKFCFNVSVSRAIVMHIHTLVEESLIYELNINKKYTAHMLFVVIR